MEPNTAQLASTTVIGKPALPIIFGGQGIGGDMLSPTFLGGFSPPVLSRASTPGSNKVEDSASKKTAFGDLRRLVTFGRRDSLVHS